MSAIDLATFVSTFIQRRESTLANKIIYQFSYQPIDLYEKATGKFLFFLSIYRKCNTRNTNFMSISPKEHVAYSKDPILFIKERWLGFDAFNGMQCKYIKPFEYQLNVVKNVHAVKSNIILKSRQMHISSLMAAYIAWYVIFNKEKEVVILSRSRESSIKILENVKMILKYYSVDDYKLYGKVAKTIFHWENDFVKNNQTELRLKNGCRIFAIAPTADAGRGHAIDFLYIDEAAFIGKFREIYASLAPCLMSRKSKIVIVSNPNENSTFNEIFLNSNSESYWNAIRLHWSLHPIYAKGIVKAGDNSPYQYSSPWFDDLVKNIYNGNIDQIEQELECVVRYNNESNKTKTISLRINFEMHNKIQCKLENGESVSDYIRNLINRDLQK